MSFAQYPRELHQLDSVQLYSPGKKEYLFVVRGGTQGLYVPSFDLKDGILRIAVINNTPDTLTSIHHLRDGAIVWFNQGNSRLDHKVLPGDTLRFFSGWGRKEGSFDSRFEFNYLVSGKPMRTDYRIWGNFPPPKPLVETKQPVQPVTQKTYYENGFIKTEVINRSVRYEYSDKVNGQITKRFLGDSTHMSPVLFEYENGEVRRKTSAKSINYHTQKIPYTVSEGRFINDNLMDGVIHFFNTKDELVVSVLVEKGVQQEGFVYKGERCNLTNSSGKKEGKWISFMPAGGYCTHYSIADYACNYVHGIQTYRNDSLIDTSFTYYPDGKLLSRKLFPGDLSKMFLTTYRQDGTVSSTHSNFKSGTFTYQVTTHYSESGCIIEKTMGKISKPEEFHYTYVNCKLHAKVSTRRGPFYDTTKVWRTKTLPPRHAEDQVREIQVKEEIGRSFRLIPYTVETGEFDAAELFLVNGTIEYRDKNSKVLQIKQVVGGRVVDDD